MLPLSRYLLEHPILLTGTYPFRCRVSRVIRKAIKHFVNQFHSQKSCGVLRKHAEMNGFSANSVAQVTRIIDPTSAEG